MTILLILFLFGFSLSQEIVTLNYREVYELAQKNNRELQRLRYQINALEIDYQLAQKYYLPVVYAGASLLYDFDRKNVKTDASLTIISTLYEFQRTKSRIELSSIKKEISQIMLQQLSIDLQLKIMELFAEASLYRKLTEVKREEMAIAYVRFDRARERRELGLTTDHEVLRLESLYREKRRELLYAQHMYNHTLLRIKELAGIPYETTLQPEELPVKETDRLTEAFSGLMKEAMEKNASLRIKELELKAYDEDLKVAKQVILPRLNFRVSTDRSGIELSTPLYDASRRYRTDYLSSLKRSVQSEREGIEAGLKLIFFSAPYEWEYLKAKLGEAIAKDRFAEENLTLRRSEYELELAFDLGYAMAEKSEAERQVMEARYRLVLFWAKLFSLAGREPFSLLE